MSALAKRVIPLLTVLMVFIVITPLGAQTAEASEYYYFNKPADGATYKVGDKISVEFYAGVVISTTTYIGGAPGPVSYKEMPLTFKVFKGGTELASQSFTYTRGTTLEATYVPKTTGKLKLCIYGLPRSLGATEEVLQAAIYINVKSKKASAVKRVKPKIEVTRMSKKSAEITCTNDLGYGMKIYRATKKNGAYKLIKTVSKATYTDKKLSAKKVYYYKVRLFAKSGKKLYLSKWSSKVKADKYKPGITLSYSASKGVKVSWQKISGAGYYLVCRGTGGVKAGLDVISCESNSTTTFYDKDVQKGKTYYYGVVGEKDNEVIVGKYMSDAYKIKIP